VADCNRSLRPEVTLDTVSDTIEAASPAAAAALGAAATGEAWKEIKAPSMSAENWLAGVPPWAVVAVAPDAELAELVGKFCPAALLDPVSPPSSDCRV
jgi:hypothetical protein